MYKPGLPSLLDLGEIFAGRQKEYLPGRILSLVTPRRMSWVSADEKACGMESQEKQEPEFCMYGAPVTTITAAELAGPLTVGIICGGIKYQVQAKVPAPGGSMGMLDYHRRAYTI